MNWEEWVAATAASLIAVAVEEAIRRAVRGRAGALAGSVAAAAVWPKARDEIRAWLKRLGTAPA